MTCVSLEVRSQYRSRHQQPRLTEAIFPPRSDWFANHRPAYVQVSILLLLNTSTKLPIEHVGSVGAGALSDTISIASSLLPGSEWRPKCQGQATSAEPLDIQPLHTCRSFPAQRCGLQHTRDTHDRALTKKKNVRTCASYFDRLPPLLPRRMPHTKCMSRTDN